MSYRLMRQNRWRVNHRQNRWRLTTNALNVVSQPILCGQLPIGRQLSLSARYSSAMAQSHAGRSLVIGGGRTQGFPAHDRDVITLNPDPAARADVTGTLEHFSAAPGSFSHIHFERVPWRALATQHRYGSLCRTLLAPGGMLTIETGMNAPILDLGSALRLPLASPMRINTTGTTLHLEQRLLHEPGSPPFTGTVTGRHRLFRDDPLWSVTDATLHEQFNIPLTRAAFDGHLEHAMQRFAATACRALSLPDDPESIALAVRSQCLRMANRADLTVGSLLEQHLQDTYARYRTSLPIAQAQIPVLDAADAHLGNTQHCKEIIVPYHTFRLVHHLAASFATPPLMIIASACSTGRENAHAPASASRTNTAASRGVLHVPAYLLSDIAQGAAAQGSSVGEHLADLVDALARACSPSAGRSMPHAMPGVTSPSASMTASRLPQRVLPDSCLS